MAKRQNFVVGSTNPNTVSKTAEQLNTAWNKYEVLKSGDLDGVFNAVSDYSNDSSNEIANAIQALTGAQPTGNSQAELAGALERMREEIETSSLTFKGYVATSAPSSSTYALETGNIWINGASMPTSFPVAASSIKEWNGSSWADYGSTYTPANFDFFRNINDNEGYYWFGGQWKVMSTDMSTDYFTLNQTSGKWEIKSSVNLPGAPTAATPASSDDSTKLATTAWVRSYAQAAGTGANTDLSNLSSTGKNISNWSTNVTNCVTEIPQDINLELSGGTLTLKAGSVVYRPNGAGAYQKLTTVAATYSGTDTETYQAMVFYDNSMSLEICPVSDCLSGASAPSTGVFVYYDTSTNKINLYGNGMILGNDFSFPVAIVTMSGASGITSIDQVFNGFGYIGSTIYALPGVKFLRMNGKNSDGTLKTLPTTISSVVVYTNSVHRNGERLITGFNNTTIVVSATQYSTQPVYGYVTFDEENNISYSSLSITPIADLGTVTLSDYQITSFKPKTVFHAVDYADIQDVVRTASINKAQSGYVKLNNGIIIQWGTTPDNVTNQNYTINFPTAFSSTNYSFAGSCIGVQNEDALCIITQNTANIIINARSYNSGSVNKPYSWIAIGY